MVNRNSNNNNRQGNNRFLRKIVGIAAIVLLVLSLLVVGGLRFWLIPQELKGYNPIHEKRWIGSLVLQYQQIINPGLLAQLTYINANGQSQTIDIKQQGNAAILAVAYLDLPGFGTPGGLSGDKLVGIDLQYINAASMPDDPLVLSSNAVQLNDGKDGFFSYAQQAQIPWVKATLYTFPVGPIRGSAPHCYNLYALPNLTFTAEPSAGQCTSPFTHA